MMEEVYSWIRNIVIYMIINTIIMNLLGNSSYKKYVSIVSGMILVLIVITPLMKLMDLEDSLDYYMKSNNFAVESSDFKNDLKRVEKQQTDAIFQEYLGRARDHTEQLLLIDGISLTEFDLSFDQETESVTFGEIIGMNIKGTVEEAEEVTASSFLNIEKIEISKINTDRQGETETEQLPSPLEINIKNKLSDFYNIEPGNINISIQGG